MPASNLPSIPDCDAMRTVEMTHAFGDLFNPPGLNNYEGCVQAALDLSAIRSVAFPPFAMGEVGLHFCEVLTGVCYIDGEYLTAHREPITFTWQPGQNHPNHIPSRTEPGLHDGFTVRTSRCPR